MWKEAAALEVLHRPTMWPNGQMGSTASVRIAGIPEDINWLRCGVATHTALLSTNYKITFHK
jgi:hypothetical protein